MVATICSSVGAPVPHDPQPAAPPPAEADEVEEAVEEEKRQRMVERSSFYDLLTGMMEIDPSQRWTPSQALQHPFITGEPFEGPFSPEPIPERTSAEEREELQRVAAKEAARVSSGSPVKKKKKQDLSGMEHGRRRGRRRRSDMSMQNE